MEKIGTSTPVDKTAAMVAGTGIHFESRWKLRHDGIMYWDHKPQTYPVPKVCTNLTGTRQGRLVVVGYYGSKKKSGSLWVVRCDCGMYETRRGKVIRNPANSKDRCYDCRKLEQMQRHDEYRRLDYNRE